MAPIIETRVKDIQGVQRSLEQLAALFLRGRGSPENMIAAPVGALYLNENGGVGTTLYIKESGAAGNTGWVAK